MKEKRPLIAAKKVTFGYEPGVNVIQGLSLNIKPGEKYVFVGPNGSGKTTLANLLAGSLAPQRGQIEYHPDLLAGRGRKPIACVRQNLSVFPALSVGEHFRLLDPSQNSDSSSDADAETETEGNALTPEECLQRVGAKFEFSTKVDDLPFSSRQLLEIALALWQRARVLILDEPTSALDSAATEALFDALENLSLKGVAIILISHNPQEIARLNAKTIELRSRSPRSRHSRVGVVLNQAERKPDTVPPQLKLEDGRKVPLPSGEVAVVSFGDAFQRSTAWLTATQSHWVPKLPGGVRAIPSDREKFAIFPSLSANQNYQLLSGSTNLPSNPQVPPPGLERFSIVLPSWDHSIAALSGGNQQKLVLGSVLAAQPGVVLAEEPLLGLDQRAQDYVAASFREYLNRGGRIAVFTCFPEAYQGFQSNVVQVSGQKADA